MGNSEWNTAAAKASGHFGKKTKFKTIHYPLDFTEFCPGDKTATRAALGIDPAETVIGFACDSLDNPRKGMDTLWAALAQLPAEFLARTVLLSFGHNPASNLAYPPSCRWIHLGRLSSTRLQTMAYRAMDVMVVPSTEEAFGQTALEALACGTAVVASDVGGLNEALFDGKAGTLCPVGDSTKFAQAIVSVWENSGKDHDHVSFTIRALQARHASSVVASAYVQLYAELLRSG